MKKMFILSVVLFALMAGVGMAQAMDVTLAWDANPAADNVTGYKIYYSTVATIPTTNRTVVDIPITQSGFNPALPQKTITGLANAKIYFAATAYNVTGESAYSNIVNAGPLQALPSPPSNMRVTATQ